MAALGFVAQEVGCPAPPLAPPPPRPTVSDVPQIPGLIVSLTSSGPAAARRDATERLAWGAILTLVASCISGGILVVSLAEVGETAPFLLPSLAAISCVIAVASWLRLLLSMNRIPLSFSALGWCGVSEKDLSIRGTALCLFLVSAVCYFASAVAIMTQSPYVQFTGSLVASVLSWVAFVIVFNMSYECPSKEQFGALFQIVLLSILWEVRAYVTYYAFHRR